MLHIELPHINVMTKLDLLGNYGDLGSFYTMRLIETDFDLSFYTQVQDLSHLLDTINANPFAGRFPRLNQVLCELVEEFGLVSFFPLAIEVPLLS